MEMSKNNLPSCLFLYQPHVVLMALHICFLAKKKQTKKKFMQISDETNLNSVFLTYQPILWPHQRMHSVGKIQLLWNWIDYLNNCYANAPLEYFEANTISCYTILNWLHHTWVECPWRHDNKLLLKYGNVLAQLYPFFGWKFRQIINFSRKISNFHGSIACSN